MNSIITEKNPHAKEYINDLSIFDHILHDPALLLDPAHVIGKIDKQINLADYTVTNIKEKTEKSVKYWDSKKKKNMQNLVYNFGHSVLFEGNILEVAIDAKLSGLIKNAKIDTLLNSAEIMTSDKIDKPVIFKLGSTCYFIAPVVFN
jgi:hypothetical protein